MKYPMRTLIAGTLLLVLGGVGASAQTARVLNPLTTFGPNSDGRINSGSSNPLLEASSNQRGMAVDPVSGNIVLVDAQSGTGGSTDIRGNIFILGGNDGLTITTLNTNGMGGGTYASSAVAVADDGAVYVCNQINNSTTLPFTIYRWSNVTSTDAPTIAFTGNLTPAQRYGAVIDARGSGPNTQIIIGPFGNAAANTNVVIFTTADGMTFTPNVLSTDVTTGNFGDGIAFGSGNTFWAKRVGAPLLQMSFTLSPASATTLSSFSAATIPHILRVGPIEVDTVNNLLAAIEVNSTGSERVLLYDISGPSPVFLDEDAFTDANSNTSTPSGTVGLRNGRLYAHVVNNGMVAFNVDSSTMPNPTILTQPAANTRVAGGQTLSLSVAATHGFTYQWLKGITNVPNATNAMLQISNVTTNDSGTYSVVVGNSAGSVTSDNAAVTVVNLADLYHFNTLWPAPPGPVASSYVSTAAGGTPNERGIAYNAVSNHVYVVQKNGNNYNIHVVNGSTGQKLYNLNTNGIVNTVSEISGSNPLNLCAIGVDDDGAIYACNLTPNAGGGGSGTNVYSDNKLFRIYRWANADPNTLPTVIYQGDPVAGISTANYRWGDVLQVRGSGLGTQILLDNHNVAAANRAFYAAILVPTDETMTTWTSKPFFLDEAGLPWGTAAGTGGSIGRSIDFGTGDVMLQKRRGTSFVKHSFQIDNPIPSRYGVYAAFPSTTGGLWINPAYNVAVALNLQADGVTTPDSVNLYDVTDITAPLLIAQYNFPQNHANNGNFIGWCAWEGNKLYALAGNNGMLALELVPGPPAPPVFTQHPRDTRVVVGSPITLSIALDSTAAVQWQKDGTPIFGATGLSYTLATTTTNHAGLYNCIATNSFGAATSLVATVSIEMPEDYHSLTPFWTAAPDTQPYATSTGGSGTPLERSFAYNAALNQLIVVQCPPTTGANPTPAFSVQVVDAATGNKLYDMITTNIGPIGLSEVGGANPLNLLAVAVAEDGAVYACNGTPNASGGAAADPTKMFRVYRWANSDSNTVPVSIFAGDPAGRTDNIRWGDVMAVRGSGANTEILLDSWTGSFAAVLKPLEGDMNTFTNYPLTSVADSGSIGRSIQFGTGTTSWQKRKGTPLTHSSFDLDLGTSMLITNYTFPASLGPVVLDLSRNIMAGLDFFGSTAGPDAVALYDIDDFGVPLLIAKYNFPQNAKANANFIGQVIITADKVFALDGNNGFLAFNLVPPGAGEIEVTRNGSNITLSWTNGDAILQSTTDLTPPRTWTNVSTAGQTSVVVDASTGIKFYRLEKP
jgi:hypothetical protein